MEEVAWVTALVGRPDRLVYYDGHWYWTWPGIDVLIRGPFDDKEEAINEATNTDLCLATFESRPLISPLHAKVP